MDSQFGSCSKLPANLALSLNFCQFSSFSECTIKCLWWRQAPHRDRSWLLVEGWAGQEGPGGCWAGVWLSGQVQDANSVTAVLRQCYSNATAVLQQCCISAAAAAAVLHQCYISATSVLQQCYISATAVLYQWYIRALAVLQQCYNSVISVL